MYKLTELKNTQKIILFLALGLISSFLCIVIFKLKLTTEYNEFIVGNLAWTNAYKLRDIFLFPLLLLALPVTYIFISSYFTKLNSKGFFFSDKITNYLFLWCIPFFILIAPMFVYYQIDSFLIFISFLGLITIIIPTYSNKNLSLYDVDKISLGYLIVIFLSIYPLIFSTLINKLDINFIIFSIGVKELKFSILIIFIFSIIILLFTYFFKSNIFNNSIIKIISLTQFFIPFAVFALYPSKVVSTFDNKIYKYDHSFYFFLFIFFFLLISFFDIYRRYKNFRCSEKIYNLISPFSLISLIFIIRYSHTDLPLLNTDDYHFGERLVGPLLYLKGYIPYIDFIPHHGLSNDLPGILNNLFFKGDATTLSQAAKYTYALWTVISFFSVFFYTRSLTVSFLFSLFSNFYTTILIFFISIWLYKPLLRKRFQWICTWLITSPVLVLLLPAEGISLIIASGIIPLYSLYNFIKNKEWKIVKYISLLFLIILIIFFSTPFFEIFYNIAKYVYVNSQTNIIAHAKHFIPGYQKKHLIQDIIKFSWMIFPIVSIIFLYNLISIKKLNFHLFFSNYTIIIFSLVMFSYAMGRTENTGWGRSGSFSIQLSLLSLVILYNAVNNLTKKKLILLTLFILSVINFSTVGKISSTFFLNSSKPFLYTNKKISEYGKDFKVNNIGNQGIVDETHVDRLEKIDIFLKKNLKNSETYLDLTNRVAHYYYFNRKPPYRIVAPHNYPQKKFQEESIILLKKNPPKIALLYANNITWDGGGLALRNNYLFKYIINNYEPIETDGLIFGISKFSINHELLGDKTKNINKEKKIELFDKAFSKKDIGNIGIAWGKSYKTLEKKMTKIFSIEENFNKSIHHLNKKNNHYLINGNDPFIVFDLKNLSLEKNNFDIIEFDFYCDTKIHPKIQLFFWGDNQISPSKINSIFFNVANGKNIIPIDSSVRWNFIEKLNGFRFDLHDSKSCNYFSLNNIIFKKRK